MEFQDIQAFLKYYGKVRSRTLKIVDVIPEDKIDWTYQEGKFTFGDLVRHIACIERFMYAENAQFLPSRYNGCGQNYGATKEEIIGFMNRCHQETISILSLLTTEELNSKTTTPGGTPITLWKWLRLMSEHEIHHRGQIYLYLGLINVATPPLYGLTAEQVEDRSIQEA
ncbi:MAG: DinB family protein [Flavobacteriales bacterium]|nr:DinB family protein [Flavobacteriales bacterium]